MAPGRLWPSGPSQSWSLTHISSINPSNATVAPRGRLFSVFQNPRKAFHLKSRSSAYTPKSEGSTIGIGEIALIMLVAVGVRYLRRSERSTGNLSRTVLQNHNGRVRHLSVANSFQFVIMRISCRDVVTRIRAL